eukprot:CAMPEP_0194517242 /NCGR_PEP_ID=MMETSP0253-20130528/50352_1 /TAXON_ID=2966 /ORGANISM="Noctiluca scintillans" /LENGTH=102 /DNA_ID=CAMNT_0039361181 /DNA_START=474 /DNA_END=782 /DNA_ORIENTATION=+
MIDAAASAGGVPHDAFKFPADHLPRCLRVVAAEHSSGDADVPKASVWGRNQVMPQRIKVTEDAVFGPSEGATRGMPAFPAIEPTAMIRPLLDAKDGNAYDER